MALQNNKIINEDDWYLKLYKRSETLEVYNNKPKKQENQQRLVEVLLIILHDWESIINLAD
jgi:hypothetical protein